MTPSPSDAKPGRRSPRSSPPATRTHRSPSSTERRRLEAPGAVKSASPVPLATLPKAKAAPRSTASPQAQAEDGEPPKRKKRRRKDKINDEDAPGVMPKAAAAPKEVGDPAGDDPGALPEEPPVGVQEARPKRRTRKAPRPAGEASEAKVEEPAPEAAAEKEGAAPPEGKEGKKRRKRRVVVDAKEEEGGEAKPEGEMRVDDQAVLIAAVEELAPGQAEANAAEAPKTKRRRKRKIAAAEMQPLVEQLTGDGATADGSEVNERYSALIRGVYQRHNPAKLNEVESLLIKYQGMEAELYHRVCEKYQETPQEPTEPGGSHAAHTAQARAPPSRVAAGEAWPFEENEVSMNSESSSSSQAGDDAPKIVIPPVSGIFDAVETKEPENSPSSPSGSSRRSPPPDDLMQRFTSLAEPKPGGDVEPRQELPAWAQPPDRPPPHATPNGRQDAAIPSWALPQDAPPGDWGRPYPNYGRMGGAPPGPPGWGGKGWGYPGYPALPAPQAQRSWADSIGSAWAQ